jgi:hypothetical protein
MMVGIMLSPPVATPGRAAELAVAAERAHTGVHPTSSAVARPLNLALDA